MHEEPNTEMPPVLRVSGSVHKLHPTAAGLSLTSSRPCEEAACREAKSPRAGFGAASVQNMGWGGSAYTGFALL